LSRAPTAHDEELALRALAELRNRLEVARIDAGLSRTQLARRAGLSRTTVYQALIHDGPVPSGQTLGALGRVLKLSVPELLRLRGVALG
jgi:DNA-binding XRE family transcriptional regulator